jgi:hypothetical protein
LPFLIAKKEQALIALQVLELKNIESPFKRKLARSINSRTRKA